MILLISLISFLNPKVTSQLWCYNTLLLSPLGSKQDFPFASGPYTPLIFLLPPWMLILSLSVASLPLESSICLGSLGCCLFIYSNSLCLGEPRRLWLPQFPWCSWPPCLTFSPDTSELQGQTCSHTLTLSPWASYIHFKPGVFKCAPSCSSTVPFHLGFEEGIAS